MLQLAEKKNVVSRSQLESFRFEDENEYEYEI